MGRSAAVVDIHNPPKTCERSADIAAFTRKKRVVCGRCSGFLPRQRSLRNFPFLGTCRHSGMYSFFQSLMDLRAKGHRRLSKTHSWWL